MEVSTLRYSRGIGLHGRSPLLRLQSDERLIAYVRRGNNAAFEVLVARYQSRLLSFCRHLLGSREDAEDVLQEVMAAAFNAILADDRPINVRPWLYRIARNRSLNHLRRIQAVGVDSMDVHLSDNGATTADKVHEREEFRVLVEDIHDLPETQRTALVLREMDALSYEQIAEAMETTVSSVKSLLVRARVSLAEAAEARLLSCDEVRIELGEVAEGLRRRPSSLVRRHLRSCKRCSSFKVQLRETNKALTALLPIGPMVFVLRKLALVHLGHSAGAGAGAGTGATGAGAAGQAAAVGGTAAAGAGATATLGSAGGILSAGVGAIATKAAAGLAAAALVTAGAVEVSQRPAPTNVAATHHHPVVVATRPPAPAPATHSDSELPEHRRRGASEEVGEEGRGQQGPRQRPGRFKARRQDFCQGHQDDRDDHHDHRCADRAARTSADPDRPDGAAARADADVIDADGHDRSGTDDNDSDADDHRPDDDDRPDSNHPDGDDADNDHPADNHDAAAADRSAASRRPARRQRLSDGPGWRRVQLVAGAGFVYAGPGTSPASAPRLPDVVDDGSIDFDHFQAVDMRVGRVVTVEEFPEARKPAWKLTIDFGPEIGTKKSSARIAHYSRDELEGSLVVAVVNFPPRQIGPVRSEVLVLGALDDELDVVLLRPDRDAAVGSRIA